MLFRNKYLKYKKKYLDLKLTQQTNTNINSFRGGTRAIAPYGSGAFQEIYGQRYPVLWFFGTSNKKGYNLCDVDGKEYYINMSIEQEKITYPVTKLSSDDIKRKALCIAIIFGDSKTIQYYIEIFQTITSYRSNLSQDENPLWVLCFFHKDVSVSTFFEQISNIILPLIKDQEDTRFRKEIEEVFFNRLFLLHMYKPSSAHISAYYRIFLRQRSTYWNSDENEQKFYKFLESVPRFYLNLIALKDKNWRSILENYSRDVVLTPNSPKNNRAIMSEVEKELLDFMGPEFIDKIILNHLEYYKGVKTPKTPSPRNISMI